MLEKHKVFKKYIKKKEKKTKTKLQKRSELMDKGMESQDVSLQAREQSNQKPLKEASNWSPELFSSNSSNQKEDQAPFLVRPRAPQKIERRSTIIVVPSHNESKNDPQSPHNSDTCNTTQQNQTPLPLILSLVSILLLAAV